MNHTGKPKAYSKLGGLLVGDGYPVRVMGIVNVSPESFFKHSVVTSTDAIKRAAERMDKEGADILDIGARGAAPYLNTGLSDSEELGRICRAIEAVRQVTDKPISANTMYAHVARAARGAGAAVLNDISGLAHDALLPKEAAMFDGVVLTANADYANVLGDPATVVRQALRDALHRAQRAGVPMDRVVLDPGIGFFRNRDITWDEWDRQSLRHIDRVHEFHMPVLVGLSRKSFIGKVLEHDDPEDRLYGSLGLAAIMVMRGVHMIRTHDVAATCDVVRIAQWLAGRGR